MNESKMQRLMTPSKVSAWLECPHYLTLRHRVDVGAVAEPKPSFGSFAQLLMQKGLAHEQECLAAYRRQGKSILTVSPQRDGETFSAWVQRVGNPFEDGWDVVYQMPLVHDVVSRISWCAWRTPAPCGTNRSTPSSPGSKRNPVMCCSSASTPRPCTP